MLLNFINEQLIQILLWSCLTIGLYVIVKNLYRLRPSLYFMPLILTPILIACILIWQNISYQSYFEGTKWLVWLLGPATVSFAIPIYEQRQIIKQYWPVLLVGIIIGSITAISSTWALATIFELDKGILLSLLPRSISTPFAMEVARKIGGTPELTAVFVIVTGILGAMIGDFMLIRIKFHSALAKGALFGLGAHAAGTAQAHKIGETEGAIAGLVMILVGLLNVLLLPILFYF